MIVFATSTVCIRSQITRYGDSGVDFCVSRGIHCAIHSCLICAICCVTPLSYIGWGKTTQLGYGLGLAMGAKLAHPDKLCINVWGDAAIGFTGMDFETAVRERIPILSILLNNFCMAIELPIMKTATAKYRSTDISGNYADMAKAFGGYGERITTPDQIVPAIKRGIEQTKNGKAALLEFITQQEIEFSVFR